MSWKAARKAALGTGGFGGVITDRRDRSLTSSSLEGADPELCITMLERGLNFLGVKNRIRSSDQQWMEHFLSSGGLTAIFDALEVLGSRGFSSIADAIRQLECVSCVKAVMNNVYGLEFIIHSPGEKFVTKLASGKAKRDGGREG